MTDSIKSLSGSKIHDLTGMRYGRLTAVEHAGFDKNRQSRWRCLCDCGAEAVKLATNMKRGRTLSCGCLNREATSDRSRVHGEADTPLHRIWRGMIQRCTNPKAASYANYGGRGITVCDRWSEQSGSGYRHFRDDMAEGFSPRLTLERIDNNRGYEPGNVRWATYKEQARNTRRSRRVEFRGQTRVLIEWCEVLGLNYGAVRQRLHSGWSIERALTVGADREALAWLDPVDVPGEGA